MTPPINRFSPAVFAVGDFFGRPQAAGDDVIPSRTMLTLTPARLEAVAQLCIQEFRQFPPTQLVMVTFNPEGHIIGTTRLLQGFDRYSTEQLLRYLVQAQAASALVADLSPWPLWSDERSLQRLHGVDELLEQCQTQGIELLDYLCIQGLSYSSLRGETDLWYAICA